LFYKKEERINLNITLKNNPMILPLKLPLVLQVVDEYSIRSRIFRTLLFIIYLCN